MRSVQSVMNSSASPGGGIHVGNNSGGSTAIIGGNALVQNCTVPGYGGGIFVHNATATVKDSARIDNCSANSHGGGINIGWAAQGTSQTRKLVITGKAQITNCSAPYGGGVNVENTNNVMPNVANINGSVTISGCKATEQGGAINVEDSAHVTSTGASMTNNPAPLASFLSSSFWSFTASWVSILVTIMSNAMAMTSQIPSVTRALRIASS